MSEELTTSGTFKIRPAGRHILTIGRDLIQDPYAAVVELVKNAYDADATKVCLVFNRSNESINIVVEDDGHGMTRDVVTTKWMVPSTSDKEKRKNSPKGRILQGRKGIGRYASSMLGNELFLETISKSSKEKTFLLVDWNEFEKAEFLSDVDIQIDSQTTAASCGTKLSISGGDAYLNIWTKEQFDDLIKELKKLKTPVSNSSDFVIDDIFDIYLTVNGFAEIDYQNEKIEPYPLFELYDYSICGKIFRDGSGILTYSQKNSRNTVEEKIQYKYSSSKSSQESQDSLKCGDVIFDIKVFDREAAAIESLIKRGLVSPSGDYFKKNEARNLLNEYNGIGVYRNGFRIRPLGNADFDWLKLNEARVQNPSMRVGSNQVIGIVQIQSEEQSNLIEKSARDGLKENEAYQCLVDLTRNVLGILETRRFSYRMKMGLGRTAIKVEKEIEKIFSFESLKKDITSTLKKGNIAPLIADNILKSVDKAEKEKNEAVDAIREVIAVYQGQATLGRMIHVLMHEGRKPLSFFKNQIPLIMDDYNEYLKTSNIDTLSSAFSKISKITQNSEILVSLFNKINPLAIKRDSKKKSVPLLSTIRSYFQVYENELNDFQYSVDSSTGSEFYYNCRAQDLYCIFINLIENSIYWINEKKCTTKSISIFISIQNNEIECIDYKDSGPGIEKNLTVDQTIFEPGFTTKPDGSGLGLSIAGEAASRCDFSIFAIDSENGAYFRMERKEEKK